MVDACSEITTDDGLAMTLVAESMVVDTVPLSWRRMGMTLAAGAARVVPARPSRSVDWMRGDMARMMLGDEVM